MEYTVKKLADLAGISVRALHYYDELGLLKPKSRSVSGYRFYDEECAARLQQIMFFRELGFGLDEIKKIMSRKDFDMLEALESHRTLILKKAERLSELLATVDKTIKKLKGEAKMSYKEFYRGFSEEKIERYRREVRERWGNKAVEESDARMLKMGKEKFNALQAEGDAIFQGICDNMAKGFDSREVQEQVARWRQWLEHFYTYSDEAVQGLGQFYSQHPEFAEHFRKFHPDFPEFLTRAIEHYCRRKRK
jgi:DNA-binding transcriptional MerR regulator